MNSFKHDLRSWLFNELVVPRTPYISYDEWHREAFKVLNTIKKGLKKLMEI